MKQDKGNAGYGLKPDQDADHIVLGTYHADTNTVSVPVTVPVYETLDELAGGEDEQTIVAYFNAHNKVVLYNEARVRAQSANGHLARPVSKARQEQIKIQDAMAKLGVSSLDELLALAGAR